MSSLRLFAAAAEGRWQANNGELCPFRKVCSMRGLKFLALAAALFSTVSMQGCYWWHNVHRPMYGGGQCGACGTAPATGYYGGYAPAGGCATGNCGAAPSGTYAPGSTYQLPPGAYSQPFGYPQTGALTPAVGYPQTGAIMSPAGYPQTAALTPMEPIASF